jgi:hypothetical protein
MFSNLIARSIEIKGYKGWVIVDSEMTVMQEKNCCGDLALIRIAYDCNVFDRGGSVGGSFCDYDFRE